LPFNLLPVEISQDRLAAVSLEGLADKRQDAGRLRNGTPQYQAVLEQGIRVVSNLSADFSGGNNIWEVVL